MLPTESHHPIPDNGNHNNDAAAAAAAFDVQAQAFASEWNAEIESGRLPYGFFEYRGAKSSDGSGGTGHRPRRLVQTGAEGYLAMDSVIISASSTDLQQQDRDQDQDQDQHASPDVVLSAHIVFSEVYSTPALFFLLTDSQSSKPLSRNMAQEFLGQDFKQHARRGLSQSLSLFSMEEHPFLRSLWFYLHPCRTREILAHLTQAPAESSSSSSSRMWQWLSIMGPALNLNIPSAVLSKYILRQV